MYLSLYALLVVGSPISLTWATASCSTLDVPCAVPCCSATSDGKPKTGQLQNQEWSMGKCLFLNPMVVNQWLIIFASGKSTKPSGCRQCPTIPKASICFASRISSPKGPWACKHTAWEKKRDSFCRLSFKICVFKRKLAETPWYRSHLIQAYQSELATISHLLSRLNRISMRRLLSLDRLEWSRQG